MTKVTFPEEVVVIPKPVENGEDHIEQHIAINSLLCKIQRFVLQKFTDIGKVLDQFSKYIKQNNEERREILEQNKKIMLELVQMQKAIKEFSIKKDFKTNTIHTIVNHVMEEGSDERYSMLIVPETHKVFDPTRKYVLHFQINMDESVNIRKHDSFSMIWDQSIEKFNMSFVKADKEKEAYVNAKITILGYTIE